MFSVKRLVESGNCYQSIPLEYVFATNPNDDCINITDAADTIPTIDFSLLTSDSPEQRSNVIQSIGKACREWGFFMVINHGVAKTVRDEMLRASKSFFDQTEEHMQEYAGKKLFDPVRWGTSFNRAVDNTFFWRDYLKVHVHPHFNAPQNPPGFSEILQEYCKRSREVAGELLKGISKSLGLEESYINKTMDLESSSHQLLVNGLQGLQVHHNGSWVSIDPLPDSFVVNIGDHMEILSNGKYKSVLHRAVVNGGATRVSIATAHGPPLQKVVVPAPELVHSENRPPAYRGIKYKEYMELQQSRPLDGKSCLTHVRI
ncbi:hypothetical protein LWI28_004819 [Acer negundo]|uniref:Fe2OG dioxygenase domain-containing protein n=1 Tax=Acer negundo TaxID=4023 RepID=A0AAD5JRP4_ACENE|nr:hypothetical protein LWI28_004819 [Acer negundo]